jgi:tetratricopeptide (TPR) repeat protein
VGREDIGLRALQYRGVARHELGDATGIDDLREALRRSLELGHSIEAINTYNNLGDAVWFTEGPARGLEIFGDGLALADRRGATWDVMWIANSMMWPLFEAGRWDELLDQSDQLMRRDLEQGGSQIGVNSATMQEMVLVYRGETDRAAALMAEWLPRARLVEDPQMLLPALTAAALLERGRGDIEGSMTLISEMAELARGVSGSYGALAALEAARLCIAAGRVDMARSMLDGRGWTSARSRHVALSGEALLAEAGVDLGTAVAGYGRAERAWREFGNVFELGQALLGRGRCLIALGGAEEAREPLEAAREVFESLRARPLIEETDGLLGSVPD